MAVCDTGPLVALLDVGDPAHEACRSAFDEFRGSLVTTCHVLTEGMHLLYLPAQRDLLLGLVLRRVVELIELRSSDLIRIRGLMAKYADLPMDVADASVVAIGERLRLRKVFTLDRRHFRLYRPRHIPAFEIFP